MGDAGLTPHEQAVASDIYDAIDTERAGSITVARLQSHVHEVPLRLLEQNPHLLADDDQTRPQTLGSTPNLSVGKENTLRINLDASAQNLFLPAKLFLALSHDFIVADIHLLPLLQEQLVFFP